MSTLLFVSVAILVKVSQNLIYALIENQQICLTLHTFATPSLVGVVLSNVCDILNVVARARERAAASVKDEMADEIVAYIKDIVMAFAAQHATAVIEDTKFAALTPWIAKDVLVKLGELKLLKT